MTEEIGKGGEQEYEGWYQQNKKPTGDASSIHSQALHYINYLLAKTFPGISARTFTSISKEAHLRTVNTLPTQGMIPNALECLDTDCSRIVSAYAFSIGGYALSNMRGKSFLNAVSNMHCAGMASE